MQMNMGNDEVVINIENLTDALELTDTDLAQIQGGGGGGPDEWWYHSDEESHHHWWHHHHHHHHHWWHSWEDR